MTHLRLPRNVRFLPLGFPANTTYHDVFYYDSRAPLEELYECARGRLEIATNLLYDLYECKGSNDTLVSSVARAVNTLIGESYSILDTFNPQKLRNRRF